MGDLREKVDQIHEVGKAAAELVNILRAPKLRGGMGELFLNDLLAQILPPEHFRLQHHFKSGDAVDAVIAIGTNFVPVDSKFPLRISVALSKPPPRANGSPPGSRWSIEVIHQEKCSARQTRRRQVSD